MLSDLSRFILLALAALMAISCGQVREESLLYGHYIAEYEFATEKIQLKKDGTFVQEVTLKTEPTTVKIEGKWKSYIEGGYGYIEFDHNFMLVVGMFMKLNPNFMEKRGKTMGSCPIFLLFIRK